MDETKLTAHLARAISYSQDKGKLIINLKRVGFKIVIAGELLVLIGSVL